MGLILPHDIAVDLVRNDPFVMLAAKFYHLTQFFRLPDAAHGIMRAAEDEPFVGRLTQLECEIIQIHRVAAVIFQQRISDDGAAIIADLIGKGIIDRRLDDDAITRLAQEIDEKADSRGPRLGCRKAAPGSRPSRSGV